MGRDEIQFSAFVISQKTQVHTGYTNDEIGFLIDTVGFGMCIPNGFQEVDFLCGDFHWKKLWHLDPEPLFKFVGPALREEDQPREKQTTMPTEWGKEAPVFV